MDESSIAAALSRLAAETTPTIEVVHRPPVPGVSSVGLVPGAFDPMTIAHAALAEALHREGCDFVLFVFSATTLPKEEHAGLVPEPPLLEPAARVSSLVAFARPRPWAGVAIASHGLLADQAEAAARTFPGRDVVLGVGSDKLLQLFDARWYDDRDAALSRLFHVARVAYALRGGDAAAVVERAIATERRWRDRVMRVALPPGVADVSSRRFRMDRSERWVPVEVRPIVRARSASSGPAAD